MCRLFSCIPIFKGFFLIRKCKNICLRDIMKVSLLPVKSVFINVEKGMSELGGLTRPNTYCLHNASASVHGNIKKNNLSLFRQKKFCFI